MTQDQRFWRTRLFIPNAVTALAILCGYIAIIETFQGNYVQAAYFIIAACILDMFDGRLARLMRSSSAFGVQFDSLADMVNYGVAPALLFYFAYFREWGVAGIILSFLPVCSAAVRLARYNVAADPDVPTTFFTGLPTTIAALVLAGFVIFAQAIALDMPSASAAALTGLMAFLMVSTVQYEKKNVLSLRYIRKTRRILTALIIGISLLAFPRIAFFAWGLLYILYGLVRSIFATLVHWRTLYKHRQATQRIQKSLQTIHK